MHLNVGAAWRSILPYLGLFWKRKKLINVTLWREKHNWCGAIGQSGFPSTYSFPKANPSPGGSFSVAWPCGDALGCGHWAPKHPGKRCSKGRGAPALTGALAQGPGVCLSSPHPCCCCSPGMACGFLWAAGCPSVWFASVGEELILAQGCSWSIWQFQLTLNFVTNCCSNWIWCLKAALHDGRGQN